MSDLAPTDDTPGVDFRLRVALALVVLLTAAVASSCGSSARAAPRCSLASARGTVTRTKPTIDFGEKVRVTPSEVDQLLCFDLTHDGRSDMAVSVASGGSAGDVGWLVFVAKNDRWRLAASGSGYKLSLFRSSSDLEVGQPVYRKHDPNCCPTGGYDRAFYRWDGTRLVVARTTHTKTFT